MKIRIIAIGKNKDKNLLALQDDYLKRCKNWKIEVIEVEQDSKTESRNVLKKFKSDQFVIVLDEHGLQMKSTELAAKMEAEAAQGKTIVFLIGAADGHSAEVLARADLKLAFGKLTWAHMLVRIMLAEQIYRIWSILAKHPYHRE